jgi:adenylosuccinate lyase
MGEPFAKDQIGSSAMAYKKNPMRAERMCALARFAMSLGANGEQTMATQWLERTLDDSANRRLSLPQAFLAVDAILLIYRNIVEGIDVFPKVIEKNLNEVLPFMATEEILMAGVRAGGDRQELHEAIRVHSLEAAEQVKVHGTENDLIDRLKNDSAFAGINLEDALDARKYIGRAPAQVDEFIDEIVNPLRKRFAHELEDDDDGSDLKV